MYKILSASADTYITNKFVNGERQVSASLGYAGTIDIFKLYGITEEASGTTKLPLTELSRGLIKFDTSQLHTLYSEGKIDPSHSSFRCSVVLKDVYGGQTTPNNFRLVLSPLSRSFSEGTGKDVSYYSDWDVSNFLSSSRSVPWVGEGASYGGALESGPCDFFTTALLGGISATNLQVTQSFAEGTEDAVFDVTQIMSATLVGSLPDSGFRLALESEFEGNEYTYFVKRFASRHAHNQLYRPKLVAKFDDSVQDDSATMLLGSSGSIFAYNYDPSGQANFFSGAVELTGANCVSLTLVANEISGQYTLNFTGSQFSRGNVVSQGVYFSNVLVNSAPQITAALAVSGSVTFTPIWKSIDGTVTFFTGSAVQFLPSLAGSQPTQKKRYAVSAYGIPAEVAVGSKTLVRVHMQDQMVPRVKLKKFAVDMPSSVVRKSYYQVRDVLLNEAAVPFDTTDNSTRLSTDSTGQYFYLDTASLLPNRAYVIDFMTVDTTGNDVYMSVSNPFRVVNS